MFELADYFIGLIFGLFSGVPVGHVLMRRRLRRKRGYLMTPANGRLRGKLFVLLEDGSIVCEIREALTETAPPEAPDSVTVTTWHEPL